MFKAITSFLRKRCIKKYSNDIHTGMIPLSQISNAISVIDISENNWQNCAKKVNEFYASQHITGDILFVDLTEEGIENNIPKDKIILRKNLNIIGKPRRKKTKYLLRYDYDIFISLIDQDNFTTKFISNTIKAKFKIGCKNIDDIFDIVINKNKETADISNVFDKIADFIIKIR